MKQAILVVLVALSMLACKDEVQQHNSEEVSSEDFRKPQRMAISDAVLENAVIYEANIRQYSPEGTFNGFTKDIPQLKELGVQVLWLMPIHPISMARRKAENDSSVEDIKDPKAREKYLGSPYAVADYTAVNPDFGTMDDFRKLVQTAHDNGIYVIIDWVPNHTGWDHPWITAHPEYYTKNEQGEITDPLKDDGEPWGWTDVADLNYDNKEMQRAMIDAMKFWVVQEGIDGFRCDVAHGVPVAFWNKAIPELRAQKPLFMMAEAELPELMKNNLFEMSYGWEGHHLMNAIAKGEKSVSDFDAHMIKTAASWEANDILMNFITNHDENSWAGPVKERMGDASDALLALTYCMPGMPLIYSGQEYDLDRRLAFFEKDSIPKEKGSTYKLLQQLGELKNNTPALHGGKNAASYERLETSLPNAVLAFKRVKGESELLFIANLTEKPVVTQLRNSVSMKNALTGEEVTLEEDIPRHLEPWEYLILKN